MKCNNCKQNSHIISCTVNSKEEHHSFNDFPALEFENGSKYWYLNGKSHREGGPAYTAPPRFKEWYLNDTLHRVDGPAIEYSSGNKEWWVDGKEVIKIQRQELYIEKIIQTENQTAIVLRQINDLFWEILLGDEKRLVVAVQ